MFSVIADIVQEGTNAEAHNLNLCKYYKMIIAIDNRFPLNCQQISIL